MESCGSSGEPGHWDDNRVNVLFLVTATHDMKARNLSLYAEKTANMFHSMAVSIMGGFCYSFFSSSFCKHERLYRKLE